jgi:hypothetical protein
VELKLACSKRGTRLSVAQRYVDCKKNKSSRRRQRKKRKRRRKKRKKRKEN